MKAKKVTLIAVAAVTAVVLLVLGVLFLPSPFSVLGNRNQRNLNALMKEFTTTISEYASSDIIEEQSVYGKLNGNGNGIQYFGAVLVRKDAIEDIDALMAELDETFEIVECAEQSGNKIISKHLQHRTLTYDTPITSENTYVSICFYNSKHPKSSLWDLAGH